MGTGKYEHIARRAYALWQAEGEPDGRHEEHWQHAVREIEAAESANGAVKRTTRRKKRKICECFGGRQLARLLSSATSRRSRYVKASWMPAAEERGRMLGRQG